MSKMAIRNEWFSLYTQKCFPCQIREVGHSGAVLIHKAVPSALDRTPLWVRVNLSISVLYHKRQDSTYPIPTPKPFLLLISFLPQSMNLEIQSFGIFPVLSSYKMSSIFLLSLRAILKQRTVVDL